MQTNAKPGAIFSSFESGLHSAIQRRAEEIYIRSGQIPGRDLENWAQAESEITQESAAVDFDTLPAIIVKVNGLQYVGEYSRESSDSYVPGEFASGAPVLVRFDGDNMFLTRPNGKELQTRIVRRIS
jgi:Protein of unknown function (DUF2934)